MVRITNIIYTCKTARIFIRNVLCKTGGGQPFTICLQQLSATDIIVIGSDKQKIKDIKQRHIDVYTASLKSWLNYSDVSPDKQFNVK